MGAQVHVDELWRLRAVCAEGLVRRVVRQARGSVGAEVRLARLLDVRQVRCGVRRRVRR